MENSFVGRAKELEFLNTAYRKEQSAFIPIYGRRRIGKSELILHFGIDKPMIYLQGKKASQELQIREFLTESARVLNEPLLASQTVDNWKSALESVVTRWTSQKKLIVALDEFQCIVETSPSLISILQELWDRNWKNSRSIMLILCGSYLGFMEREILGKKSPLFGRRTAQIFLQPFGYFEAAQFHPKYSNVDKAKVYFLCGGIPFYLRLFSDKRSIESNIMEQLLTEYAPLFREVDFLLREELRELEKYHSLIFSLSTGSSSASQIAKSTGVSQRSLPYYLKVLIDLGYVARRYPLSGNPLSLRKVRYTVEDSLLRFWFRHVFPNESYIRQMGPQRGFSDRIRLDLESYFGFCFERLCREAVPFLYKKEAVLAGVEVGEYWSDGVQIDLVGVRDDGWIDCGECKWGTPKSLKAVEDQLDEKIAVFPNNRNATIGKMIFTRRKSKKISESFRYYDLDDIYYL